MKPKTRISLLDNVVLDLAESFDEMYSRVVGTEGWVRASVLDGHGGMHRTVIRAGVILTVEEA